MLRSPDRERGVRFHPKSDAFLSFPEVCPKLAAFAYLLGPWMLGFHSNDRAGGGGGFSAGHLLRIGLQCVQAMSFLAAVWNLARKETLCVHLRFESFPRSTPSENT